MTHDIEATEHLQSAAHAAREASRILANTGAEAMKIDPQRAGATSALTGAASFGAGSACAGFTSLISDGTARPMSLVIAASLVIALVSLEWLAPRRRAA